MSLAHQAAQLSYEEAILAKRKHVEETKQKVQKSRNEFEVTRRQYFAKRKEEHQEMRNLIETTMAGHQNAREARLKLTTMKQKIGT